MSGRAAQSRGTLWTYLHPTRWSPLFSSAENFRLVRRFISRMMDSGFDLVLMRQSPSTSQGTGTVYYFGRVFTPEDSDGSHAAHIRLDAETKDWISERTYRIRPEYFSGVSRQV